MLIPSAQLSEAVEIDLVEWDDEFVRALYEELKERYPYVPGAISTSESGEWLAAEAVVAEFRRKAIRLRPKEPKPKPEAGQSEEEIELPEDEDEDEDEDYVPDSEDDDDDEEEAGVNDDAQEGKGVDEDSPPIPTPSLQEGGGGGVHVLEELSSPPLLQTLEGRGNR